MDDDKAIRRFKSRKEQTTKEHPAVIFLKGSIVSVVIGLVTSALQIAGVINMEVAHLLMFLALVVSVVSVWFQSGYTAQFRITSIAILIVFFGGADYWMTKRKADSSDVGLHFVYPDSPALMLINLSKSDVARDIKYTVLLWNLNLPERFSPLPIPVSAFDWIKPEQRGGPQNLFSTPLVEPLLHSGDRVFGCASVTCPACIRDRAYVVSIIWKQGGWFAEIPDENGGKCFIPRVLTREGIVAYVDELSLKVPEHSRIPIKKLD